MGLENGRRRDYFSAVGKGMQPTDVRNANQRAIFTVISILPGLSNADLARRTGLAPQTVSAVLADLEAAGRITRGEVRRGRRGQPATPLYLDPLGAFAIGAEIGWRHIEVTLVGLAGQVIDEYRRPYDYPDAASIFEEMRMAVARVSAGLSDAQRTQMIGLGLAAPSGIGEASGLLAPPGDQSRLWAGLDMVAAVAAATGLDVQLFNDGNAACWAELVSHPTPRPHSFAFLLIDTFVAAGMVAENRLWEGVTGASANLGSMLVTDRQGASRFVHQIASCHALRERLLARGLDLAAVMSETLWPEAETVLDAWIEDSSFALAQVVLNTATVIEFEVAIIETVLPAVILDRLVEATRRQMRQVPSLGGLRPLVHAGYLGRSGAARGAAQLRLYRRFFSRELQHLED